MFQQVMGSFFSFRRSDNAQETKENFISGTHMAIYLPDRVPKELAHLRRSKTDAHITIEELAHLRRSKTDAHITIEDLLRFDQMHYLGVDAMSHALGYLQV
eukprot:g62470.t1